MRIRYRVIEVIFVLCTLFITLSQIDLQAREEKVESVLKRAREAAAADRHAEAIHLYFKASRLDTTLSCELGKEIGFQYTWSDKSDSAIIWFESYLEIHPEDIEGMMGLARALSWANKNRESLKLYRKITRKYPDALNAMVGEARVVSWLDKNAEAEELYRQITKKHPDNVEAALGLARVVNWQGRHREARSLYSKILEKHPDCKEALKGLAQAWRWLGLSCKAREFLVEIEDDDEALEILEVIEHERAPRAMLDYSISFDSDELVIHKTGVIGLYTISDETRLGVGVTRLSMRQTGMPLVRRTGVSARFYSRFNEDWALHLNLEPLFHSVNEEPAVGLDNSYEFSPFTWDGWLTWTPARRLRMDLSGNRMAVETPLSVQKEIVFSGSGVGLDCQMTGYLKAILGYDHRSYSDENSRNLLKVAFQWRIISSPVEVKLQPGYTFFSFREWKPNGYYNPEEYHNVGLQIGISGEFFKCLYYGLEGRISREKEEKRNFFSVGSFRSSIEWKAGRNLKMGGEFFTSNSRVAGEAGYSRRLVRVFVKAIF
ncbi:tetratricopeptide repeat protein [bacterium]|nr:tetratricopeptide repeat protein [bacterium]